MSKKSAVFGMLATFVLFSAVFALAQEENQQSGFPSNLIEFANKIGIPLKAEEVYDPLVFFQSYGFTILLSLIAITLILYIAKNIRYLIKPSKKLLPKPSLLKPPVPKPAVKPGGLFAKISDFKTRLREKRRKRLLVAKEKKEQKEKEKEKKTKQKESAKKHRDEEKHKKVLERKKHRKTFGQTSRKRIFNVLHKMGLAKTEEEKKKLQDAKKKKLQEKIKQKEGDQFSSIKQKFRKLPKDSRNRIKLEVAIARAIESKSGSFSVTDVMKKIDEMYKDQMERKDRIEIYDDLKSLVSGDLCQKAQFKNNTQYYRFV